jgi:hypothetical protein
MLMGAVVDELEIQSWHLLEGEGKIIKSSVKRAGAHAEIQTQVPDEFKSHMLLFLNQSALLQMYKTTFT